MIIWAGWSGLEQRPLRVVPRLGDTSDTSDDEIDMGETRQKMRSKRTYKMKNGWENSDVGQFFCDWAHRYCNKAQPIFCRIARKSLYWLKTHGQHVVFGQYQGSKHFRREERLRLETLDCEVFDYQGNTMSTAEVERQRDRTTRGPLAVRDR